MEPLQLLTWVGAIGLSVIIAAIAIYTVFVIIQNMRGKTTTKPKTTVIQNGRD